MEQIAMGILNAFLYSLLGVALAAILTRVSLLLFSVDISSEVKQGNNAVAYFALGLFILIGLIVGFVAAA